MVSRIDLHSIVFEEKSDGWCQGDITGHNRQGEAHNSRSKIKSIKTQETSQNIIYKNHHVVNQTSLENCFAVLLCRRSVLNEMSGREDLGNIYPRRWHCSPPYWNASEELWMGGCVWASTVECPLKEQCEQRVRAVNQVVTLGWRCYVSTNTILICRHFSILGENSTFQIL